MVKAVIFDMDGVLVNSEPHHFAVEKILLTELGIKITDKEIESFVGLAMDKMWQRIKNRYALNDSIESLVVKDVEFRKSYFSKIENLEGIPGVEDLIKSILEANLRTAVASSSHKKLISTVLEKIGFTNYFPDCISGSDVEHGKPQPDIFLKTAEIISVDPSDCLVIEDSYNGVQGAKAAGMKCIAFRNPESGNQDLSAADMIIDSFIGIDSNFIKTVN